MQEAPAPAAPAFAPGFRARGFAVGIAAAAALAVVASAVWLEREAPSPQAPQAQQTSGLSDAPELDRLLGRTREVELSVTVDGEEVTLAKLPSTDPRVRIYALE